MEGVFYFYTLTHSTISRVFTPLPIAIGTPKGGFKNPL
jgi:hypothetical protein